MKKINILGTLAIFGLLLSHTAKVLAEPTLYPRDPNILYQIENTTTSNILADDLDPRTIWVMPPNTAQAKVHGLHSRTSNMGFCKEMGNLQRYNRGLSEDMDRLARQLNSMYKEIAELQREASRLDKEAEAYATERNLQAINDLDQRIAEAEGRLSELYELDSSCTNSCEHIINEIDSIVKDKNEMLRLRRQLTRENTADYREYNRRRNRARAAQRAVDNATGGYRRIQRELSKLHSQFLSIYNNYGQMEGARAAILYKSSWDKNIETLRHQNPGYHFAKIATKNATLMSEIAGVEGVNAQGAIMAIGLGGKMVNGVADFTAYPENLSTNVVLSLIGACPMEHPEYFDIPKNSTEEMAYGLIISYEYDSVFDIEARMTYNMRKVYERITSAGSRGGLFRSRSWSSVQERNFFEDAIEVEWLDKENFYSAEERDALEQEMRNSIFSRLASMALPDTPIRSEILEATNPPERGAVVLGETLMKTCPTNKYCLAGASIAVVLDSIFGRSSATTNYSNIIDATITENYSHTRKITKSWLTSYTK